MKMLAKEHGLLSIFRVAGVNTLDPLTSTGWTQNPADDRYFTSATYFDLGGLAQEDKTMFVDSITTQSCGLFGATGFNPGDSMVVFDIITSIPVDIENTSIQSDIFLYGLGFNDAVLNFEHVLYQRMRRYACDIDTAQQFLMLTEDRQSGSMSPTASDRLYSYRMVGVFITAPDATTANPPTRHLIRLEAKEEPTYSHMMRLKRSYDLQQVPDRD